MGMWDWRGQGVWVFHWKPQTWIFKNCPLNQKFKKTLCRTSSPRFVGSRSSSGIQLITLLDTLLAHFKCTSECLGWDVWTVVPPPNYHSFQYYHSFSFHLNTPKTVLNCSVTLWKQPHVLRDLICLDSRPLREHLQKPEISLSICRC